MVMVITSNFINPNECVLFSDRKDSIARAPISQAMKDFIMGFDGGLYPNLMPERTSYPVNIVPEHHSQYEYPWLNNLAAMHKLLSKFPAVPISES